MCAHRQDRLHPTSQGGGHVGGEARGGGVRVPAGPGGGLHHPLRGLHHQRDRHQVHDGRNVAQVGIHLLRKARTKFRILIALTELFLLDNAAISVCNLVNVFREMGRIHVYYSSTVDAPYGRERDMKYACSHLCFHACLIF